MTDHITLRRAAEGALEALDSDNPDIQLRAAIELRAALAEPVRDHTAEIELAIASAIRTLREHITEIQRFRAALEEPVQEPVQEPVAWQDTTKPTELVSAEEWEYIDPMWHWMYRPLYTSTPDHTAEIERAVAAEREACALTCENELVDVEATNDESDRAYNSALGHAADAIRARGDK